MLKIRKRYPVLVASSVLALVLGVLPRSADAATRTFLISGGTVTLSCTGRTAGTTVTTRFRANTGSVTSVDLYYFADGGGTFNDRQTWLPGSNTQTSAAFFVGMVGNVSISGNFGGITSSGTRIYPISRTSPLDCY